MTNTTATTKGCRRTPSRILNGTSLSSIGSNPAPIHREKPVIKPLGDVVELPASADLQPGDVLNIHVGLNRGGLMLANRRQIMPARVVWVYRCGGSALGYLVAGVEFRACISAHLDAA